MYAGPITRTYYSMGAYSQDAALMATYGYRAVNMEEVSETHGLMLTLLLIFGLLLTPFCIGIVILCFLPVAFTKRYNVSYVYQNANALPPGAPAYSQPLTPSYSRPLAPPSYSQPLAPPSYSQPLAQPATPPPYPPNMPPAQSYQALPSQRQAQQPPLGARFSEGLADLRRRWNSWTPGQRALTVVATVVVVGITVAVVAYVAVVLMSGSASPA